MGTLPPDSESFDSDLCLRMGLILSSKRVKESPMVLSWLSSSLERSVLQNEKLIGSFEIKDSATVFHGRSPPDISVRQYLDRIFKYSGCSPSCFVVAQIYMDRFLQLARVHLTSLNVHRLLITSVMLAAKVLDDRYFNNAYYARVGGVSTRELNRLEMKLLFTLDFKLQVKPQTFHVYCCQLEKETSGEGFQIEWPIQQACRAKEETWPKRRPESACPQTTAR
ncbi:PREDICTED: cyclin-U3-1 [Tarenaya hassleriana]|uniref:cyclin-U3-1 n=1 Tax=Tarenaya hassleriana TaxID=28532 RepID=UPI00053C5C1A|nr:PREDICTED: cyclin-U3-1 [Tarenaya hassleriana]